MTGQIYTVTQTRMGLSNLTKREEVVKGNVLLGIQ